MDSFFFFAKSEVKKQAIKNIRKKGGKEMAKIINVEKNAYLQENIEKYTSNKVNQYSKFLDKNPLFITYLSINEILTRNDVGTGGIESDIGPTSPVRFNQINNLPAFNIPELKPEILFDDRNGYDVELDISDVALPPNTIKPKTGDYIIIKIPNSVEVVFRVNEFRYNTIQSNDFYIFSADLKYAGTEDQLERFKPQIVEVYETIFDNIGTQDKCFIRSTDMDKIKALGSLIYELLDLYKVNFFDNLTGTFVSKNNTENVDPSAYESWYFDKYVTRFIMDSEIYFDQNSVETIALSTEDIVEQSDKWYHRTLYYAVLKKDSGLLGRFPYAYQVGIQKGTSVFVIYDILCRTAYLHITDYKLYSGHSDGLDSTYLYEYFPHKMIHAIMDNDKYNDKEEHRYNPHDCWKQHQGKEESIYGEDQSHTDATKDALSETRATNQKINNIQRDVSRRHSHTKCGDFQGVNRPESRPVEPPTEDTDNESYQFTYLDEIIISYLLGKNISISRENLIPYALQSSNYVYKMMPMIVFIIIDYYNSYFKEEKVVDL